MVPCAEAVGVRTNVQARMLTISTMTLRRPVADEEVQGMRIWLSLHSP
jgi:hypothetical protein